MKAKDYAIIVLGVAIIVAYLVGRNTAPTASAPDRTTEDSLRRELIASRAAREASRAKYIADSAAYVQKITTARQQTAVATEKSRKTVDALRAHQVAQPDPGRDSVANAAIGALSEENAALRSENAVLTDRVAQAQNAYNQLSSEQYVADKIAAALDAESKRQYQELKTDYDKTARANRRLKTVALITTTTTAVLAAVVLL